ncbi:PPC domain-containing protein [Sporosarcina limicola]|uniref:Peptidase C-terminal archaeal/bacterial domain-containing protein n=1 Tax=Sporosarcina limicola TaxID=34101 RepID=A0A927MRE9_9BACL|nr:PPC domain-containing protein [Sporosarcina limicola]MBE1555986.1 hypothetical protein [Sporosarcina limicola]
MKKICVLLFTCLVAWPFLGEKASAEILNEVEPNNTPAQAQLIQRNNHDPSQMLIGNNTSQKVVAGSLESQLDEDWYKVSLPANAETVLSINGSTGMRMTVDVFDSNFTRIRSVDFQKDPSFSGAYPYIVDIPSSGDYYVKVFNPIGITQGYLFTIGSPNYSLDTYYHKAWKSLTLTPTIKSVQDSYNFTNILSVPKNAVVYRVSLGGVTVNSAISQYRKIKLSSDSSWTNTAMYTWHASIPVQNNKLFHSTWNFSVEGTVINSSKPFSLTPDIGFSYVYPILPQQQKYIQMGELK